MDSEMVKEELFRLKEEMLFLMLFSINNILVQLCPIYSKVPDAHVTLE